MQWANAYFRKNVCEYVGREGVGIPLGGAPRDFSLRRVCEIIVLPFDGGRSDGLQADG